MELFLTRTPQQHQRYKRTRRTTSHQDKTGVNNIRHPRGPT
jgi:hypothetical protein